MAEKDNSYQTALAQTQSDAQPNLRRQYGSGTDIGGGRENQDACFIWDSKVDFPDYQCTPVLIMGMLDGHGRDYGKLAADKACSFLTQYFTEHWQALLNPSSVPNCLIEAHVGANTFIKQSFKEHLEGEGFIVEEQEGYLVKKLPTHATWSCVHGGSTCTIVAQVGTLLYSANVGDSSVALCIEAPVLLPSMLVHIVDSACPDWPPTAEVDETPLDTLILNDDHSPEDPREFVRLRAYRSRDGNPNQPSLDVVYDAQVEDKSRCPPVFKVSADGTPTVTGKGIYHKNVGKEWASLVSTPSSAHFQDALAFTRSLGDLNLTNYGVTHLPVVKVVNLEPVFAALIAAGKKPTVCIVLATDGVWDNWQDKERNYDVQKFVMDPSCLNAIMEPNGGSRVTKSFMERNTVYGTRNFRAQRDNATGIVCYLSIDPTFPDQPLPQELPPPPAMGGGGSGPV